MKALVALCSGAAAIGAIAFLATRVSSVPPAAESAVVGSIPEFPGEDVALLAPDVVLVAPRVGIDPTVPAGPLGEDKKSSGSGDAAMPDTPKSDAPLSAKEQARARLEEKIRNFLRDQQSARRER